MPRQTGAVACVVASNYTLGDAYMRQGKFEDAKRVLERGNEVAGAIDAAPVPALDHGLSARKRCEPGRVRAERRSFDEALAQTRHERRPLERGERALEAR